MNHIRKTNIIQITENFEQSLITQPWRPLDKYISDHFKKHNKCTPKDKAIITARVYDLQKWKCTNTFQLYIIYLYCILRIIELSIFEAHNK